MKNKIILILMSFILVFSFNNTAFAKSKDTLVTPQYYPLDVSMSFWDAEKTRKISSVEGGEDFVIRLDLAGGSGEYDIFIDFGNGHTLVENNYNNSTFETSYHYFDYPKTYLISVKVTSITTKYTSKSIFVYEPW